MELEPVKLTTEKNLFFSIVYQELKDSLVQGWQNFNESDDLGILNSFFEFLLISGFDESEYRKKIPNPAYDQAARLIGKLFLETAKKYEIQFDEIFPGNFSSSEEAHQEDFEIRLFHLKAFYRNKPLCLLLLKFPHFHKKFGFPLPPELEILETY